MSFKEKNGLNNNEMSQNTMASIEKVKTSNRGFELSYELRNFPVTFVNAIRRLVLSSIPTVVIRDVQILDAAGKILASSDHDRRFFEASFMHQ
jgi:DNA-directed RNA polymerase alpha subunit